MKKSEIQEGSYYQAKVSGKLVVVKVLSIEKRPGTSYRRGGTSYSVLNTSTGRTLGFVSAAKFLRPAADPQNSVATTPKKKPTSGYKNSPEDPHVTKNRQTLASKLSKTSTAPHVVTKAFAGSGKTFTEIMGIAWAFAPHLWKRICREFATRQNDKAGFQKFDPSSFVVTPSQEQEAVWNEMRKSKGEATSVVYSAFNKSIVVEFQEEWGWLVTLLKEVGINLSFATVNSLGFKVLTRNFGRLAVENSHTTNLVCEILEEDIWRLRREEAEMLKATEALVGLCKLNLTGWTREEGFSPEDVDEEALDELAAHYDIQLNGNKQKVYALVPKVLRASLRVEETREIDFNDQNWLPVVLGLSIPQEDLLLIDEAQDLPRVRQEFLLRVARRAFVVGDTYQAIYGFAGADTESIPRLEKLLESTDNGLVVLKLSETRRCGKAIVREAQSIVADFTYHEDNPEGLVRTIKKDVLLQEALDGDMVLSRVNAPLVSTALGFIKEGRKALIRGRKFGTELINFIKKQKASNVSDLLEKVGDWYENESRKESRKRNPSEARLIALEDRKTCVEVFCEDSKSLDDVTRKVGLVFSGKQCPKCRKSYDEETDRCYSCKTTVPGERYPVGEKLVTPKGILCSSVHRAKGLEAENVFLLKTKDAPIPHPMAKTKWQREQEYNLLYVAITRAKETLSYVVD